MKLRSLFSVVPAASALQALRSKAAPVSQPAWTPAGFAIAVQCWTFKEFTLFEAIEMAAAAGAGAVELFPGQKIGGDFGTAKVHPGMPDEQVRAILDQLELHHLIAVNYGVADVSRDEAEARKTFEFAKKLGMYGITTESIGALGLLEKLAREYDIRVCLHNHPKPTALWNPETVWSAVRDRHEHLGFCADTGHWAASGLDPLEVVRKVAPRVRSFHLKDRESIRAWTHDRPFGTGAIDIPAILDEARAHGFAGNVSIEYEHNWEANLIEVAQCAGYLRAYAGMRA